MREKHKQYIDFVTFVMIHAAKADTRIAPEEKEAIQTKVSVLEYKEMNEFYNSKNDTEKSAYMKEMSDKWLKTNESRSALLENIRNLIGVDNDVDAMEQTAYKQIRDIVLDQNNL